MRNTILTWLWAALLLIVVSAAEALQPKQIHRIGFLFGATRSADSERLKAFRQGLREHENEITRLTLAMGDTPVCSTGFIRHFPPHVPSSSCCILTL